MSRDRRYLLRHLGAILALPLNVLIVIPAAILFWTHADDPGWRLEAPLSYVSRFAGAGFIVVGLSLMYATIILFFRVGDGTLAPWDPPTKFVARGIYRHVRNPMMLGVFTILVGEALLFGSLGIFVWFACFAVGNMLYMPLMEEPALERRFGEPYRRYRANVPRWIPRRSPWQPS